MSKQALNLSNFGKYKQDFICDQITTDTNNTEVRRRVKQTLNVHINPRCIAVMPKNACV